MFYIGNYENQAISPKNIYVKIDDVWTQVQSVYVNQDLRSKANLDIKEMKLSNNKRGLNDKIAFFEELNSLNGSLIPEEQKQYDDLKDTVKILELEMIELNKQQTIIDNEIYFNTKIVPLELFIRQLKDLTQGSTNYKVIKMVPTGKLAERPMVIFNDPTTDGYTNNVFYRIVNTVLANPQSVADSISSRVGPNALFTLLTPQEAAAELNLNIYTHEVLFNNQLKQIQTQQQFVDDGLAVIKTIVSNKPELDHAIIDNHDSNNSHQLGSAITKSQDVGSLLEISKYNANNVTTKTNIETRKDISQRLFDLNTEVFSNMDITDVTQSKNLSINKFTILGIDNQNIDLVQTFKEAKPLQTVGYIVKSALDGQFLSEVDASVFATDLANFTLIK